MKLKGHKLNVLEEKVVVIPRQQGNIVFKCRPVTRFDEFERISPQPQPPKMRRPGEKEDSEDLTDEKYLQRVDVWAELKTHYMVLKSLEATDGLEFERVDWKVPRTWRKYKDELADAGFSPYEVIKIVQCAIDACGLSAEKIDAATDAFLAGEGVTLNELYSRNSEPLNTQSGEPANESESVPQESEQVGTK